MWLIVFVVGYMIINIIGLPMRLDYDSKKVTSATPWEREKHSICARNRIKTFCNGLGYALLCGTCTFLGTYFVQYKELSVFLFGVLLYLFGAYSAHGHFHLWGSWLFPECQFEYGPLLFGFFEY